MAGAVTVTLAMQAIRDHALRTGTPEATAARIVIEEGFLRRAAMVDGPFVLKGSYVTRQRIREGWRRIPGDLDWVALEPPDAAQLTAWVTAVTDIELDDGVRFRSFSGDPFWRRIEYAMDEDFPTVNTDIAGWIGGQQPVDCRIDVSFGLALDPPPQAMPYRPQFGAPFMLPNSVSTELQIAWKLHQCLARPRFKDMLDLILLLEDNRVDAHRVWEALARECGDRLALIGRFDWLLDRKISLHPGWQGRGSAEACFADWSRPQAGHAATHLYEAPLDEVYAGGRDRWCGYHDFIEELACSLRGANFRHVPAPVESVRAQAPLAASQSATDAAQGGVAARLARWFGRRR